MSESRLNKLLREEPVVVTGMGAYCAAGATVDCLWEAAREGRSSAAWREFKMGGKTERFAVCSAAGWDGGAGLPASMRKADRSVQMGYWAARQAWEQAGLAGAYPPERMGVAVGTARGPIGKTSEAATGLGSRRALPTWSTESTIAAVGGALAQGFNLQGPGATISAACASGAIAIAQAAEQIVLGRAEAMVSGGTEAPLLPVVLAPLRSAGMLGSHEEAARTCRPFDVTRNGLTPGEGSAFLVLESARGAAARGARVLARLAGWATGVGDGGRAGMREDGGDLLRVMREALEVAGLSAEHVDYINAHGTGTELNDLAEARAMRELLGERAAVVPCSSTKPVTGHCLGATPALEAVIAIEALRRQMIPPTANCVEQDPRCAINVQALKGRPGKVACAMSNSLGFWGYHASLIFAGAR